jgi:hypothetical protein
MSVRRGGAGQHPACGDTSVTNNPGGSDYRAFLSNVVLSGEYRPGPHWSWCESEEARVADPEAASELSSFEFEGKGIELSTGESCHE